ncbi:uracil-DNA glycosylase [Herbaspirillum sp. AP02]|uniref:uracil-DNA glycosylase n=1 Tax=unclassified Herbaspirillum TaxID=2624150 RepID=UPI0015D99122|nr:MULTISPECIES: uracil-DNA glycosylase [unclassified Herbaspirillum]MBG7618326.1 uracil-DNA glycosylase [Herbaspirillum sp. AP02]NZD68486.1 uracil-DNA glycosylase [Herbaspirillum sp. AP21]
MNEEMKQDPGFGSSLALLDALGIGPVWVRRELAVEEAVAATTAEEAMAPQLASAARTPDPEPQVAAPQPVVPATVPVAGSPVSSDAPAAAELPSARPAAIPAAPAPRVRAPVEADGGPPSWLDDMDFAASMEPMLIPDGDEEEDVPAVDPVIARIKSMDWPQLKQQVAECRRCGLCQGRKNTVFGVGDEKAKWLFIGEGPGRNEDMQGEPFVGPAGKLLDNMLLSMGVKRGANAYIANIVKCRPTDDNGRDRPPSPQEVAACLPYLQRQIELIQPTVLVALGKTAALSLLGLDPATPVSRLRGSVHRYQDLPLVVTYHPAYLLRTLNDKSKAWADLCLAMSTYQA